MEGREGAWLVDWVSEYKKGRKEGSQGKFSSRGEKDVSR